MTILDECEIRSLLARERFARDTGQFQKLRQAYHPDASKTRVHIMWYDGEIDGFVSASERLHDPKVAIMHQIMPAEIDVNGSHALAQSWCVIDTRQPSRDGHEYEYEYDMKTYVRFFNRCQKVQGTWKLLTLELIYLRDVITPVHPAPPIDFGDLSRFRKSYRFTAWAVEQRGLVIKNDLAGDDDPASVDEMITRNKAWIEAQTDQSRE